MIRNVLLVSLAVIATVIGYWYGGPTTAAWAIGGFFAGLTVRRLQDRPR